MIPADLNALGIAKDITYDDYNNFKWYTSIEEENLIVFGE